MCAASNWKVEPLDMNSSKYVKPIRLNYVLNGKPLSWECMKVHDSVAIIVYNETRKKLIFVKQLRPAVVLASAKSFNLETGAVDIDTNIPGETLELCAGIIDKSGKSKEEIAKEEVLEEIGYDIPVKSLQCVFSCRSGVGVTGSLHTVYFAKVNDNQRVTKGGGVGDEQIEIIELDINDAKELLWKEDKDAMYPRPASMVAALSWFIYEFAPKNNLL
ncbi:uridine diphosphate glucose pyrophosphatase-like protein [Leptotrombidium deliense]|uniref:Uridine diphosphate glucose pyrophosphatase NUDT14 n=1 Tax=Leptotrombidium deliense TaxID=299467 RepID=A0A443S697_9ACAR|nr:uridine diphosphate glucose pyrophosphatase-like protein [Leptotrombidium deliense]